jgi:predicted dehydrogenase
VQHIEAQFCFLLPSPQDIRFQYGLAGGALMDAGCYPVSMIRFLAGAEPSVVRARARLFRPQVDRRMDAELAFEDGRTAHLVCDMLSPVLFRSFVKVTGEAGSLTALSPFQPHWFNWLSVRGIHGRRAGMVRGENAYALQLRAFAHAVRDGGPLSTGPQDAVGNMRVIDAIYEAAGLKRRGTRTG